jgi:glycosyltransferase involved in cell wall biosynthesis
VHILFLCNFVPEKVGAYEWFLVELSRQVHAAGDRLSLVLGGQPPPPMAAALHAEGLVWTCIEGWTDAAGREHAWRFVMPVLRLLRHLRPDLAVVNYGNEFPTLAAALLAPLVGCRRVRWVWQQHQQVRDPAGIARFISRLRLLALRVHHFIAVYEGGRDSMIRRGIPADRIAVVYNGIRDHRPSQPSGWLRRELSLPPDSLLLATIGWLIPRKRIDFILRAFAAARPALTRPATLLVLGDGPERETLQTLAQSLAINRNVRFLGLRNDVRDILHEADVLVHAALAETCTYAISEAMASARPAVVTEAGAAREQIDPGATGEVLGRDDAEGVVRALVRLLNDDALRREMGLRARRRWEKRYRVETSARQYHTLCRLITDNR